MMLEKLRELEAEKGFDDINIIRGTGTRTFMDEWVATDLLGRGSFGNVYRIVKPQRGVSAQECALKICEFSTPEDGELKRQEIETQKLLAGHPNAVQIEDYSLLHRAPPRVSYLLIRMELLNRLPEEGLSEHETIRLGIDICSVLEKCASLEPKLIHCDIKPANILVSNDGRYKLGDFGTAKTLGATMTYTGNRGTPLYMAPEVASFSGYDSRCDIFSLGYTMLTMLNGGRHPYEDAGDVAEILRCMYESRKLPQINGVSPGLMKILRKMCEPSLQQRYSRASEVRRDLERFVRKKEETIRNNRLEAERQSELAVRKTKAELEKNMKAAQEAEARANLDAAEARTAKGKATVKERARIQKNIERLEARIEQIHSARRYVLEGVSYKDAMRMVKESQSDGKKRGVWGIALIALAVVAVLTAGVLALTHRPDSEPYTPVSVEDIGIVPDEELERFEFIADEWLTYEYGLGLAPTKDRKACVVVGYEYFFTGKIPSQNEGVPVIGIAPEAFRGCPLKEITIPDSVIYIGDLAFYGCADLEKISIGENVKYITSNPFVGCSSLRTVSVSTKNKNYKMDGGILCSTDGKHIVSALPKAVSNDAASDESKLSVIPEGTVSIGSHAFNGCSSLTEVRVPEGVAYIGDSAFFGCDSLERVTLPKSVYSIGAQAFGDCKRLSYVNIPAGVANIGANPFSNCPRLTGIDLSSRNKSFVYRDNVLYSADMTRLISAQLGKTNSESVTISDGVAAVDAHAFRGMQFSSVHIPDSVETIGASAFENCSRLVEVYLPDSVTELSEALFRGCGRLSRIELPNNLRTINAYALADCYGLLELTLPDSLRWIKDSAFENCERLSRIELPGQLTGVGNSLFCGCADLREVYIPEGLVYLGDSTFEGCSSLVEITVPDGIHEIGDMMFRNCRSLKTVNIPESVTFIGCNAFENCTSLETISIPEGIHDIGDSAFANCRALARVDLPELTLSTAISGAFRGCSSLTEIVIPDSIMYIGPHTFENCVALKSVTLPENLESIGEYAFGSCSNLSAITIPEKVNSIGVGAFFGCKSLRTIIIPDGVMSIEDYTFDSCENLHSVSLPNTITSIGSYAFRNCMAGFELRLSSKVRMIGERAFEGSYDVNVIAPYEREHYGWNLGDCNWYVE